MIRSAPLALVAALGALIVEFFVSVFLAFLLIGSAYRFAASVPGGGEVSSYDQLYKLGSSPQAGFAGLLLIGIVGFLVTIAVAAIPATRPWAWLAPLGGAALAVLTTVAAIVAFQPAPPDLGG